MRVAFVIKALAPPGGGAERVLASLASGLACRNHEVAVVTSDPAGASAYYELDPKVELLQLGIGDVTKSSGALEFLARIRKLRSTLTELRPDVVIAFMHPSYIPTGIALLGTSIPVVASEHTTGAHYRGRLAQRTALQLTPLICKQISVVSEQVRQTFGWWLKRKMLVIPNPVIVPETAPSARGWSDNRKIILSVGRLGPEKRHSLLISAFAAIARSFPDWKLRIVGDGEMRSALEAQISELGLTEDVELTGMQSDVEKEYENADLFVVPSKYESFGMALAEALLAKLPAIGFADCPGVNCMIRDGENGRLVTGSGKAEALASAMEEMMRNDSLRSELSNAPRDWLISQFGLETVLNTWEAEVLT
jgi:glycosyltransferase involved in cell wall biosynthesis